jgi:aldose sugar dehydrogenase
MGLTAIWFAMALQGADATPPVPTSREAAVAIDSVDVSSPQSVNVERIARGLRRPWSLAEMPDGAMLITELHHGLVLLRGGVPNAVGGLPTNALRQNDSGFLDVLLDPDFAANRLVYVAFVEGNVEANRTAIWRARLDGDNLVDGRVIFRVSEAKAGPAHPGGRMLFLPDGTLLLSVGDGYDYRQRAQDKGSHLGKMLRLTRDGGVPADNPFVSQAGVLPEIWTLGHRNIQGLARDPASGDIWSHEHGPRGGDEVNQLRAGQNYGWPTLSHGIDYDGTLITERAFAEGFARSSFYWAPSIAPSGLAIYRGTKFGGWDGKMLVGALAARGLIRLRRGGDSGLWVEDERMLTGPRLRIRDVRLAADGHVYILTDEENGQLWRLLPSAERPAQQN